LKTLSQLLDYPYQSLKSSVGCLQQSEFKKAIGDGKRQSVQSAIEQITTFESADLPQQLRDVSNMLESGIC
jgi:hypothetical protein